MLSPDSCTSTIARALCGIAVLAPFAPAQQPSTQQPAEPDRKKPQRLPTVIVTAPPEGEGGALEQVPLDNQGARDVISPRQVRESPEFNIQGVLRRSPSIFATDETGSDSLPNISVRGLTGDSGAYRSINLSMLADGIPLAPAPYAQPGNSLFPFLLERVYAIDIERGGSAVRYGPNNTAGTINFLTRPIPETPTMETRVRYDTFENASYYGNYGTTVGPFGVLLEAVYKQGETYRDNGDYRLQNYALKTSYRLSEDVRLFAQVERFEDDTNLSDGLSLAGYRANPEQSLAPQNRFNGDQKRANASIEWQVSDDTLLEIISYWYDGLRAFHLGSPLQYGSMTPDYIQSTPRNIRTAALQAQVTHRYTLGGARGELLFGMRYLQEDVVRTVTRLDSVGMFELRSENDYDYYTGSMFLENRLEFDAWTITPGVRLEHVDIDGNNRLTGDTADKSFAEVLPALSVSRRMGPEWSLFANAQQTFYAPTAPQIEISTLPQDIRAQRAWVYEVGSRTDNWDGLLATDLVLYHIDYRDKVERDPQQMDVFDNVGRTRHRGVELKLESDLTAAGAPGLSAWVSGSYNDSRYRDGDDAGNRPPAAPEYLTSAGLRYEHERSGIWAGVNGYYVDEAYSDRENTIAINATGTRGVRPSYRVFNASIGWNGQLSDDTDLSLLIGARNVFDEDYFEVRGGRGIYPGAPFSMVFEIGCTHRF